MVISATGTPLSPDIAKQRIRAIIDADPRIKGEIDARIAELLGAPKPFRFFLLPAQFRRARAMKKPYSGKELDTAKEDKARDEAIYAQYVEDDIFGSRVDSELA